MSITHFLLQSNHFPAKWQQHNNIIALKMNHCSLCCIKTIKCFITSHKHEAEKDNSLTNVATETGINGVFWRPMENVTKALRIPVVITGVLLGLLLLYDHHQPHLALADSGGQASSSSEVYSTQISSPTCMEPSKGHAYELLLIFPVALVSWSIIKWLDDKLNSEETSVLKLQVGLLRTSSTSLQSEIKRIAATSTKKGLSYVLQESALALLRHRDYCISGYSSVNLKRRPGGGEKQFNHLYIEERAKFNKETLVDVNDKKSAANQSSNNEYAMNVEVLRNPQNENDFLTEEELLEDYPLLHPI